MHEFPDTSHSLISRVKDLGDGAAWTEFLGIYQPVVFRMARRRGLQDADAQDVMQQVFLSIARSIEGWTPGDLQPPFRAWLTTIARNAITKGGWEQSVVARHHGWHWVGRIMSRCPIIGSRSTTPHWQCCVSKFAKRSSNWTRPRAKLSCCITLVD